VNNRTEHIQVRTFYDGLWSAWKSHRVAVAYTVPAIPVVYLTVDTASVTVTVENMAPSGTQPTVSTWDIYRAVTGSLSDAIRVAAGVSADWTDYAIASGVDYSYRALAIATTGATTYSEWEGTAGAYLTAPTGWTWALPFSIIKGTSRFYAVDFDVADYAPTGKAYYVSTAGNDANDGLTAATPLRKISTAIAKGDVVVVYVASGVYGHTNGVGNESGETTVSVIATGGRVTIGSFAEGLTWALDTAGGRPNTWKAGRSVISRARDAKFPNANGDHTLLTLQANADAVEAAPGSWYTDGTSCWVQTADSREIDGDVRLYFSNTDFAAKVRAENTRYYENIDFEGGKSTLVISAAAGPLAPTALFKGCTIKYGSLDGVEAHSATTYFQACVAACNADDGFSYHVNVGAGHAIELDCVGRNNGATGDTDNGSTSHENIRIVRLNGQYYGNVGRNIHDVGADTKSWNLGCVAHDSASAVNDGNFAIGTSAGGGEMWLDRCTSYGSAIDLEADTNATLHTRQCTTEGNTTGGGTIAAY
jgi:hypothetical protein